MNDKPGGDLDRVDLALKLQALGLGLEQAAREQAAAREQEAAARLADAREAARMRKAIAAKGHRERKSLMQRIEAEAASRVWHTQWLWRAVAFVSGAVLTLTLVVFVLTLAYASPTTAATVGALVGAS